MFLVVDGNTALMRENEDEGSWSVPEQTRIGRVLLRVGSVENTVPFYRDTIGLDATRSGTRVDLGTTDECLLILEEDSSVPARSPTEAGLFHVAIRVPTRDALGDVLNRIRETGRTLQGASDHLVSEALYLSDPEGNGVEVYWDRPRSEWPTTPDGQVEMDTRPLDLSSLENRTVPDTPQVPAATDIGHIHLEVLDLTESEAWYRDRLGLPVMTRYGNDAVFLGAGGYHHHVGLNTWQHRSEPAMGNRGIGWFEVLVPSREVQLAVLDRVGSRDRSDTPDAENTVTDPNGIRVRVSVSPE